MSEIIKSLEEYLKDNKEKYEEIVVKNGFFGDSITCELYYDEVKDLIQFINKLQEENQALKNSLTLLEKNIIQLNDKQRDLYKNVIDETRDVIEKMIHIGYTSEEHLTSYFATSEKSEFGCRAKLLLEILDKAKDSDN